MYNVIFYNEREIRHKRSSHLLLLPISRWVFTSYLTIRMFVPLISITLEFTLGTRGAMVTIRDLPSYLKGRNDRDVTWLLIVPANPYLILYLWRLESLNYLCSLYFISLLTIYFEMWQNISCFSYFVTWAHLRCIFEKLYLKLM